MPSKARNALDDNLKDIRCLLELHTREGETLKGKLYGARQVLSKSAIVLITAYWEAYCEDIAAEALEHIVEHSMNSDSLPKELKKQIAKELKKELNELAVWNIADNKWKELLQTRLTKFQENRNRRLNTPKSAKIDELFYESVGIKKISDSWEIAEDMTAKHSREKLDKFVELRGAIAHRGQSSKSVQKAEVEEYLDLIKNLAAKTGWAINKHVKAVTKKPLYQNKKRRMKVKVNDK